MLRPVFLLFIIGILQSSCAHYQRYSMSKSRLEKINPEKLSIYLLDAGHPNTRGWYVQQASFEKDWVNGTIIRMSELETLEAATLRDRQDASESRNDVLLYLDTDYAAKLPDTSSLKIPGSKLQKVEVCELNINKTIAVPMIGCTGVLLGIYLLTGE